MLAALPAPLTVPSGATTHRLKRKEAGVAVHIYRDAVRGTCDQLLMCSNDSDMEPALQMVRDDVPDAKRGLVMPLREKSVRSRQGSQQAADCFGALGSAPHS